MRLLSPNFQHQMNIPSLYTCDDQNISPSLYWTDIPEGTGSFAISVIDPDAPGGNFIHWLIYDIPKEVTSLPEGGPIHEKCKELPNDFGVRAYGGPCPPSGVHRYYFTLYALKVKELKNVSRANFLREIENHSLATAELIGLYSRERA